MSKLSKGTQPSVLEDFYKHVPQDVREEIKGQLLRAHIDGMDGFIEATQFIIAQLISGNIAPAVADSARGYMELLLTAISAKLIHEKERTGSTNTSMMARVVEAQKRGRKMIPQYTLDVDGDGGVKTSVEMVRAKK